MYMQLKQLQEWQFFRKVHKKIGSIGIPITNGKIYIVDENRKIMQNLIRRRLILKGKMFYGLCKFHVDLDKKYK